MQWSNVGTLSDYRATFFFYKICISNPCCPSAAVYLAVTEWDAALYAKYEKGITEEEICVYSKFQRMILDSPVLTHPQNFDTLLTSRR